MKMFGKLTRETVEWHPDKLLCKRFNIANPYPEYVWLFIANFIHTFYYHCLIAKQLLLRQSPI